MSRPLWNKYIAEGMLLFIGLAIGAIVFSWFRVWIVGELDTAQFRQIIDLLPKDWRKFASVDFDWLVSYLGRTALTLDEPMLISLFCAWGLVRGSDVVSGELGRGTMELLLAQPVSRRQVFLQHAWMTILFLFVLILLIWLGMSVGIWTTSVEESTYPVLWIPIFDYSIPLTSLPAEKTTVHMASVVNPVLFLPGLINLFCVGVCLSGFAAFCSAFDRYRWRTLGIVAAFYFFNAGMKILGMGSERFSWAEHCSIFGLYHPANAIEHAQIDGWASLRLFEYAAGGQIVGLGTLADYAMLLTLGVVFYAVGLKVFVERDLPAPV